MNKNTMKSKRLAWVDKENCVACGALIGAVNVLGAINRDPMKTMASSRKMITNFKEQNTTVICKELKGITDGMLKRECIDCVRDAARLLEEELGQ